MRKGMIQDFVIAECNSTTVVQETRTREHSLSSPLLRVWIGMVNQRLFWFAFGGGSLLEQAPDLPWQIGLGLRQDRPRPEARCDPARPRDTQQGSLHLRAKCAGAHEFVFAISACAMTLLKDVR